VTRVLRVLAAATVQEGLDFSLRDDKLDINAVIVGAGAGYLRCRSRGLTRRDLDAVDLGLRRVFLRTGWLGAVEVPKWSRRNDSPRSRT
jgi:hypothetical protein